MSLSIIQRFEAEVQNEKKCFEELFSFFQTKEVKTRDEAYIHFSKALKISQTTIGNEILKQHWLSMLNDLSFCLQDKEPVTYRFDSIIELVKSGKKNFDVKIEEVDPKRDNLANVAEAIDSIFANAFGRSHGADFFKSVISSPNVFCLLAKTGETPIACTYGTYVEMPNSKLFHFNVLGRKVEYPSIHILERLQGQVTRIKERFPNIQYLTLCVETKNDHMMPIYKGLGFAELEYIENGPSNKQVYFYGKKIDPNSSVEPPPYLEFRAAIDAQRAKEKERT